MNQKGFAAFIVIVVFFGIIIGTGLIWYQQSRNIEPNNSTSGSTALSPTIDPVPTINNDWEEIQLTMNILVQGEGYYPSKEVKMLIPKDSKMNLNENKDEVTIEDNDFSLRIRVFSDASSIPYGYEWDTVSVDNTNFEGDVVRVFLDNEYHYSNSYYLASEGRCSQHHPEPISCGGTIIGPFNISCETEADVGLEKCDAIVESIDFEPVTERYVLNSDSLKGEQYPYLEFEIPVSHNYEVEVKKDEILVKGQSFVLNFVPVVEVPHYWAQYLEIPEATKIETTITDAQLYRVKREDVLYADYNYSTSYAERKNGGCEAYGSNIVACDGGIIDVRQGDKKRPFGAGCTLIDENGLSWCDLLMESLINIEVL